MPSSPNCELVGATTLERAAPSSIERLRCPRVGRAVRFRTSALDRRSEVRAPCLEAAHAAASPSAALPCLPPRSVRRLVSVYTRDTHEHAELGRARMDPGEPVLNGMPLLQGSASSRTRLTAEGACDATDSSCTIPPRSARANVDRARVDAPRSVERSELLRRRGGALGPHHRYRRPSTGGQRYRRRYLRRAGITFSNLLAPTQRLHAPTHSARRVLSDALNAMADRPNVAPPFCHTGSVVRFQKNRTTVFKTMPVPAFPRP